MLNNCFLDLQRAATALYLNPQGKTHLVFLEHAQKIVDKDLSARISKLRKEASDALTSKEAALLADKILTLGLLAKTSLEPS